MKLTTRLLVGSLILGAVLLIVPASTAKADCIDGCQDCFELLGTPVCGYTGSDGWCTCNFSGVWGTCYTGGWCIKGCWPGSTPDQCSIAVRNGRRPQTRVATAKRTPFHAYEVARLQSTIAQTGIED